MMKADGSERVPFIPDRTDIEWIDVCGEGSVVFVQRGEDKAELWRADVDGTNPSRLAELYAYASGATCSPDGKSVFYSWDGKVWRLSVRGGYVPGANCEHTGYARDGLAALTGRSMAGIRLQLD